MCVPEGGDLWKRILEEAHRSEFTIHPGINKMYQDLKKIFWWPGMKPDAVHLMSKCLVCQKVKVEHQKPSRTLQPLENLEWKWESISTDFVMGLSRTPIGYDAIWVIVDRLTKFAYFLPTWANYPLNKLCNILNFLSC